MWGDKITNIRQVQQELRKTKLPEFAPEIRASDLGLAGDTAAQLKYFQDNGMELKEKMQQHGAVVFRGFDLMKTQDGFQEFYKAVGMKTCLDPLHSVSARPTVDGKKNSPVYEAVNKESRKNFFIGMHNEFVGTRAPRAAAFVCFKAAETGGEFLLADGRRMFRDLDSDLVEELYNRQIRYSVMELPFFGWVDNLPGPVQEPVMGLLKGIVSAAVNAKVDFSVDLREGRGGYDNTRMLQARAPSQPPIVVHPVTGDPTWFCNVHSHSSKLRHDRESIYGAERFEDGASQINKSDMFFGDDGEISDEQLKHMDEVTMKNVKFVKMSEGDVVLLDNYKCMHGRNVFDGTRKHGVAWFEGWEGEEEMKQKLRKETALAA
uniref:TauD/TfdA-like domain-containing protein n=1 Tax=Amphora coffeiformis TaxID=265554 RepID=A0A7S3L6J5_9STRA